MKVKIIALLLTGASFAFAKQQEHQLSPGVYWLTPTYKKQDEFVLIQIVDIDIKENLQKAFASPKAEDGINPILSDRDSNERGFVMFVNFDHVSVYRIYSNVNKPQSANVCKIRTIGNGVIEIVDSSISSGILANFPYRTILRKIKHPEAPQKDMIFNVKIVPPEVSK